MSTSSLAAAFLQGDPFRIPNLERGRAKRTGLSRCNPCRSNGIEEKPVAPAIQLVPVSCQKSGQANKRRKVGGQILGGVSRIDVPCQAKTEGGRPSSPDYD